MFERVISKLQFSQDPFVRQAQNVFDAERQRRVRAEWAAAFLALVVLALIWSTTLAWSSQTFDFAYVMVDPETGAALSTADPGSLTEPSSASVRYMLRTYVRSTRSETDDPAVRAEWLETALALAGDVESQRLAPRVKQAAEDAREKRRPRLAVSVEVHSVLPIAETGDRWEVVWKEIERKPLSYIVERERLYRALVVIGRWEPSTRAELEANPYGMRVREFLVEELEKGSPS